MKKIIAILALALATATAASAQIGLIGGFTSSKTTLDVNNLQAELKNVNLYHVGLAYKVEIGNYLAIQPQIAYQVKGASLEENLSSGSASATLASLQTKTGYAELSLGLQGGVDLLAFRPFVLVEPFVGYAVTGNETITAGGAVTSDSINAAVKDAKNKLEYGFGVGGGIELLDHVQISVQWFMNLGKLYNGDKLDTSSLTAVMNEVALKDVKNYQGIKVTVGLFF